MAAELPRPGVEVIQVFKAVTPTVVTPTLVPCIVGVAKQIVEVLNLDDSGSNVLNADAQITLPAFIIADAAVGGPPAVYGGLDGLQLVLSINNGPLVTTLFSDPTASGLTPATVVSQILAAFSTAGVTAATAEVLEEDDTFRIRTVGVGDFEVILVDPTTSAAVLSAFGIGANRGYFGVNNYRQYEVGVPQVSFPDPRNNLDELVIETDSIRAFLATGNGTNLQEAFRTSAFLRRIEDDSAAVIVGTIDLTTLIYGPGGSVDTEDLVLRVDGGAAQTVTFAAPVDAADLVSQINAGTAGLTASVQFGTNFLVLTSDTLGPDSSMVVVSGTTVFGVSSIIDLGLMVLPSGLAVGPDVGGPDLPAAIVGTADIIALFYPLAPDPTAITIKINGGSTPPIPFPVPVLTAQEVLDYINAIIAPAGAWASLAAGTNFLTITTLTSGAAATLEIVGGTSLAVVGLTAGDTDEGTSPIAAIDDGNGDNFTPLLQFLGEDFTAVGTSAVTSGTVDLTTLVYGPGGTVDGATLVLSDGQLPQTITFNAPAVPADIVTAINDVVGTAAGGRLTASLGGFSELILTHSDTGQESYIEVVGGTAAANLGFAVSRTRGTPSHAEAGDELWVDGIAFAIISQVAPGGQVDVLKINKQVPIDADQGENWYIIAKNLPNLVDRPEPELVVSLSGDVTIKHELLRDTSGDPNLPTTAIAPIYLMYTAVRQDVSQLATNPSLLRFDSVDQLTSTLDPLDTQNPLGLGLFLALVNAPGAQVTGLGVEAISQDEPFGTLEAFTKAAEFLESFEVYALAPLTHSPEVAQVYNTHVTFMSEPEQKGERIVLFNSEQPTRKVDTLVASGASGNSVGATGLIFDTGIANLPALILAAGVSPIGIITVDKGLFLDVASSDKIYSIESVAGSVVTIRILFAAGENDDGFYSTDDLNDPPMPSVLINETFSVKVRGASLTTVSGAVDKQLLAETYQALSQTYLNRRFWHTMPDKAAATIEGVEQVINGFYMNAAIAGMIGQQPPQQSFTNFPMSGFTRVIGSNNYFSERQLNIIAAGGTYIIVQDVASGPLTSRFALTTDLTSIETRTDSITKVVDFTAKFLRRGVKNFIGRFNITQGFLDSLGSALQGLGGFLVESGVLIGFNLNNIIQDENAPDTVLVDVTLDVPYPCNFIRITLVI